MTFEEGYFKDSKISNYRDYTQKKYGMLCEDLIALGIKPTDRIVDFGCAIGSLLNEFCQRGYRRVQGTDVSWWAINEGRRLHGFNPNVPQYLNYSLLEEGADWILALDVLEHIGTVELSNILQIMRCKNLVVRVPVCAEEGQPYVLKVSRNDTTHIQCHTKEWWTETLSGFMYMGPITGTAIYDSPGVMAAVFKCEQ